MSCGATASCFKYPLRYIWERDFYKPHLSCFVITHCATYSNILLLPGEMQSPTEVQRPSATRRWPQVSCPNKAEPADSLNKTSHVVMRAVGEEGRLGLGTLIPVFGCLASLWRLLASHHCITRVASGNATPLLNPNDLQLFAYFPVGSSWH